MMQSTDLLFEISLKSYIFTIQRIALFIILITPLSAHSDPNLLFSLNTLDRLKIQQKPWKILKQRELTLQKWDISCGAAAVSTILSGFYDIPVGERQVAHALLTLTEPTRVSKRGGFSLLDIKHLVELLGFKGLGYEGMTLNDLIEKDLPAIIPITLRQLDHFVVFRGMKNNRIFISDPAFGNLLFSPKQFTSLWKRNLAFFIVKTPKKSLKASPFSILDIDAISANTINISHYSSLLFD